VILPDKNFWQQGIDPSKCVKPAFIYGPVYQVDCNGLYPFVMAETEQPIKLVGHSTDMAVRDLAEQNKVFGCIARVDVQTDSLPLPLKAGRNTRYVCGRFQTSLAGADLGLAIDNQLITAVHECAWYQMGYLFQSYVTSINQLRLLYQAERNQQYAEIAKLLLNSLYGKWAQRRKIWEWRDKEPAPCRWGRWWARTLPSNEVVAWRSLAGRVQEKVTCGEVAHSFPAISAFITAAARAYMAAIRETCGLCNVLYQATDSLILTERGYDNLSRAGGVDPHKPGKFKLERKADNGQITNINQYRLGEITKHSGRPERSRELSKDIYTWEVRTGLEGMVSRSPSRRIIYSPVTGHFNRAYSAGNVSADGWTYPATVL